MNYAVPKDPTKINQHVKVALKKGLTENLISQANGTGANGKFKLVMQCVEISARLNVIVSNSKPLKNAAIGQIVYFIQANVFYMSIVGILLFCCFPTKYAFTLKQKSQKSRPVKTFLNTETNLTIISDC